MTQPVMRRCPSCREYTLAEACPRDGARTLDPRPAKFSPDDPYGVYRRKLRRLDASRQSAGAGRGPAKPGP